MKPYVVGPFNHRDYEIQGEVFGETRAIARVFGGTVGRGLKEAKEIPALAIAREFAAARTLKICLKKVLADYLTLAGHDDRLVEEASLALAFADVGVDQGGNLPTEDFIEQARRQTPTAVSGAQPERGILP